MVQFHLPGSTQQHMEEHRIIFVVDLGCENISDHLNMNNTKSYFRSPFRWMLLMRPDNESATHSLIPEDVEDIDMLPDSEVMVARPLRNNSYYLHFIYKIGRAKPWRTEFYGIWDLQYRFQISSRFTKAIGLRRMNLDRHVIPTTVVLLEPDSMNHLIDGIDDHIDSISKVTFQTANFLLEILNADKKYIFTSTFGYYLNGSWNGQTGYLDRNEAELGGSPMFITQERLMVVDYISSPTPTQMTFIFMQPKLSYTSNLFLLPFRSTVWFSLLALVFLMFLALLAVAKWEWARAKGGIEPMESAQILRGNIQDVAIVIFGAACQQGSPVELKGALGRSVMLILFLTLMFLYVSYSASIVALLQSSSSQIRTLDDLLNSRMKVGVHDTVYGRYYFMTATDPIRQALYKKKIAPPGTKPRFMTIEEGVKRMQQGLFAFHMEKGPGYKIVNKYFKEGEKCDLWEINCFFLLDPWRPVRKNTPYKEMFKIGEKRIHEHGLQNRENLRLYTQKPKCTGRESNFVSVGIVDCYPALLVWTYGVIIAVFFLIIEILLNKRQRLIKACCGEH
ncbi:uncharacterized protein LOC126368893 [Pectinophora gossypiella]|uniref:uncharacterized protein LOC126368893 n=1 Tax=Pectinophora gossypiella TaxID=13191 RepID=UPI00214EB425|nr:uncharacterized protein LOC126368893 [Pectinophora gossypiella]